MATTVEPSAAFAQAPAQQSFQRPHVSRSRGLGGLVFGLVLLGLLISAGIFFYPQVAAMTEVKKADGALTYTVDRNDILITVTEDGNVESANNVDIKCEVAGGGTILSIVADGTEVTDDFVLATLDKSNIEDQLNSQTIVYEKANATAIQSAGDYEAAKLAVREYEEGTFIEELKKAEVDIRINEENLRTSQNIYQYTKKMVRKGFATSLQFEADQFAVERSQLDLEAAETRKKVLVEFTKQKTLKDLTAKGEAAAAKERSDNAALKLEKSKLDRLAKQLGRCEIRAPKAGMVVYANDAGRSRFGGQSAPQIEEGSSVRENQAIFRMPDLENMQVKLTVHESKVDQLSRGMRARVSIQDQQYTGKIVSIANQPEATSWFSGNIKEYGTSIAIDGKTTGLRPGQTAHVDVLIADLKNVLTIPVSCVVEQEGNFFCWVKGDEGNEKRPLKIGKTNDKLVEVIDGVIEGEVVLRNPRAVVEDARKETPMDEGNRDRKEFGKSDSVAERKTAGEKPSAKSAESKGGSSDRPKNGKEFVAKYDKNGDGKVQLDEVDERMKRFASSWFSSDGYDKDEDGGLDATEAAPLVERMKQGGGRPGGGRPGGGGGPGGGGRPGGEG
ncbi:MAG: HlyD family efflux transporter periplasmic adaptor subunit [Planctomycetota bacterium]|nr:HlyD family efflux transporter periplasmic adaptor subunit [Planctomycetota bacterium]